MVETQTALDEFVAMVLNLWDDRYVVPYDLDDIVRFRASSRPATFKRALRSPRYIAYCKEQDRKEEEPTHMDNCDCWKCSET